MFKNSSYSKNSPEYLYYDLVCTNRNISNYAGNTQLVFRDIRQQVMIEKPEEYLLSVIRFQLDTTSIPVHRFEVEPNQNDPNLGIYTVTLEYTPDGVNFITTQPEPLMWQRIDFNDPVPPPPSANADGLQSDSPYYYSYAYEHMIRLVNKAFTEAMIKLRLMVGGGTLDTVDPPYLVWNVDRGSASLYAIKDHYDQLNTPVINIYFNRPLYFLFSSLPFIEMNYTATKNRHYKIITLPYNTEIVNIDTYLRVDQEYTTVACWSPLSSIVFATGSLPVVSNELSDPIIYENNRPVLLSNGNDPKENIITDFISDENGYRSNLLYTASVYRYISMHQSAPIRQIEISCYWKDKFGFLRPFYLNPGASCSLKIMFKKKTATY
jgi:hypothetical protein